MFEKYIILSNYIKNIPYCTPVQLESGRKHKN